MKPIRFSRRRFAFWAGFGVASLAEGIEVSAVDDVTSASLAFAGLEIDLADWTTAGSSSHEDDGPRPEHWRSVRNHSWRWYEREHLVNGHWQTTGITTPIEIESGKPVGGRSGYVSESEVPDVVLDPGDRKRLGRPLLDSFAWQDRKVGLRSLSTPLSTVVPLDPPLDPETMPVEFGDRSRSDAGRSSDERRSRHGRPPSQWLRSLRAQEIRVWLSQVEIQDAHVRGMTFWTHLTRDHLFDPEKIAGLAEPELAELHGAAHEGF